MEADPAEVFAGTRRSLDDWDLFCVEGDARRLAPRFLMLRELWRARLRQFPQVEPEEVRQPTDDELSLFASGFLSHMLGKTMLEERHFEAIRELCWFHGVNGPKVSPTRAYVFLERWMPAKYAPDDPVVEAVRDLFIPFLRWTASATDLDPAAWPYLKFKAERYLGSSRAGPRRTPTWRASRAPGPSERARRRRAAGAARLRGVVSVVSGALSAC
nr:hypothetical protein GCM10025732_16180 [Glycomyces mayteni]